MRVYPFSATSSTSAASAPRATAWTPTTTAPGQHRAPRRRRGREDQRSRHRPDGGQTAATPSPTCPGTP
ncbi:MAG: hypothetical protein R3F43_14265 [bacterium]